ncbi:MAG TPA: hypothetical protein VJB12_05740 [Candidatus Nanoarchaeia archaeon]|nr:hypothetical protein [Candidatus Nanoarchaeia archaeon]
MVEKSFVAANFKLTYSGPFSLHDFLDYVDQWAHEHHYHKEIKDHWQHQSPDGSELRYTFELWRHVNTQVIAIVRLNFLAKRVKDASLHSQSRKMKAQRGEILVDIDGHLERHKLHAWENKPYIFFVRGIIDRFLYRNLWEADAGPLASDVRNFYDHARAFFNKEETRYVS